MHVLPILSPARSTDLPPARSNDPAKVDLRGFDLLRVLAAMGVVLLHAGVPYLQNPMPGLDWPVRETASLLVDLVFWGIEVFVMPVFLIVAGVLAWRSLERGGPLALVSSRWRRLMRPMLFGALVVLPIDLYVWLAGWVYEGWIDPVKVKSLKIDGPLGDNLWGTSHLWFLVYLMMYVGCLAIVYRITRRVGGVHQYVKSSVALVCLFAVGVLTLCFRPQVVWGFQHEFLPVPSKWIYSGCFFAGGVWLATDARWLTTLSGNWKRLVGPSIMMLAAAVILGRWHLGGHAPAGRFADASVPLLAVLTTAAAWLTTLALVGWAVSLGQGRAVLTTLANAPPSAATGARSNRYRQILGYLAAASFWIYLVHHPLLGLVHIDLKYLAPGLAPNWKWMLSFGVSVGASLLSYEAFVRRTRFGRWIGFDWHADASGGQQHDGSRPVIPISSHFSSDSVEVHDDRAAA